MVSQITNNPDTSIFKSMQSTGQVYAIQKPITPLQKNDLETKKQEKNHKFGVAVATGVLGTGFLILAVMTGPKGLRKIFKSAEKKYTSLNENKKSLTGFQKVLFKLVSLVKENKGYANDLLNSATFKDILFKKKVTDKVPFLKAASAKISEVFEAISLSSAKKSYSRTAAQFGRLYTKFSEVNSRVHPDKLGVIQKKVQAFKKAYDHDFAIGSVNDRLLNINKNLNGLDDVYWKETFNDTKHFLFNKNSHKTFIAEKVAADKKASLGKHIHALADKRKKDLDEIMNLYRESGVPEDALKDLEKVFNKTSKSFDKSIDVESDKLFDKIRDIKLGSAPTDFLGVVGAFGAAAWGLAKSDNKDERISASLQYGIPAIGAVSISLLCTTSLISAGPALVIGAVSGVAISKLGEFLDKKRKRYNENASLVDTAKTLLPTLNDKKTSIKDNV